MIWDVDGGGAEFEDGQDVGFERVTHHEELVGRDGVAAEDRGVSRGIFFGDDFDVGEMWGEAGFAEFAFLVEQVALGDEDQAVGFREERNGGGGVGEKFDGVVEHFAAELEEHANFFGGDFSGAELDGGFDGGKGEALHAVAVEFEITRFGGEQRAVDGGGVVIAGKERAVALVDAFEDDFVVPKGVVGIEADHADVLHGRLMERERSGWGQAAVSSTGREAIRA